jgi:hypothetical protein
MQTLKKLIAAVLIATAGGTVLATSAFAAGDEPSQRGFVHGTDYSAFQMDQYHTYIAHMSPENRSKLMAMQDKLMQMEMDHKMMDMKMDMEMAKAKRDIEMFIISAFPSQDARNGAH